VAAVTLAIEGATYRYAGAAQPSLRDVDLVLEPGRVIGVVGANGAGKSTLCLCAVGLAPSTIGGELTGRVLIDGLDTAKSAHHELAQQVGILFQEPSTQITSSAPSVWEEIAFGPRNLALPVAEVVRRTWSAVDALRLEDIVDREPDRLSGGQSQLVALAGVLALGPRYLVLDEPTSQLDPLGTRLVGDTLVRAARETGVGILIAEHKTDLLAGMCDEVIALETGRIVARGAAADVLGDESLESRGVAPPSDIMLRRLASAAGVSSSLEGTVA
jgi:energy-coupling factor transporter ATP-binding protein EcfA2